MDKLKLHTMYLGKTVKELLGGRPLYAVSSEADCWGLKADEIGVGRWSVFVYPFIKEFSPSLHYAREATIDDTAVLCRCGSSDELKFSVRNVRLGLAVKISDLKVEGDKARDPFDVLAAAMFNVKGHIRMDGALLKQLVDPALDPEQRRVMVAAIKNPITPEKETRLDEMLALFGCPM